MSKKTRRTRRMRNMLLVVSMMLVVAMASVGVTVAWLTAETDTITNTFTSSNVEITLTETKGTGTDTAKSFKMVPGTTIEKDPTVKVKAGSEACYVFVKLEESDNFGTYLEYNVNSEWTALTDVSGVYYRTQAATDADVTLPAVIANNTVTVKDEVTKEMLNGDSFEEPTLKVTAYAVQQAGSDDATAAWAKLSTNAGSGDTGSTGEEDTTIPD